MIDRLKSNQNIKIEKGKIKEEGNIGNNKIDINKNEKEIKNNDENEVLEEIKVIIHLLQHEEQNSQDLLEIKRKRKN